MTQLTEQRTWNPVSIGGGASKSAYTITSYAVSSSWYTAHLDNSGSRRLRLNRYHEMDCDSVEISKALDVLAEDISSSNADDEDQFELDFDENEKFLKSTIKLLEGAKDIWKERTKMDREFFNRVRDTLKYGISFYFEKPDGGLKKLYPEKMIGYVLDEQDEERVTHYIYDPTLERIEEKNRTTVRTKQTNAGQKDNYETYSVNDLVILKVGDGPFGQSVLERVFKTWRQMTLLEDAVVIYRVCLTGDSRVMTPYGYKNMEDLVVGDEVFCYDADGNIDRTFVTNKWFTGVKEAFNVKSKHFSVKATEDHPVLVWNEEDGERYVAVSDIVPKRDHFVHVSNMNGTPIKIPVPRDRAVSLCGPSFWSEYDMTGKEKFIASLSEKTGIPKNRIRNFLYGQQYIKVHEYETLCSLVSGLTDQPLAEKLWGFSQNELNLPEYVTEDFARLFGFIIGDGSVSENRIVFAAGEYHDQNHFYQNLMKTFFGNCKYHCSPSRTYGNYTTNSTLGAEVFMKMGFIKGAHNKRIPSWVFSAEPHIRKAFVLGYMDADACYRNTEYMSGELYSCNYDLIADTKELWSSIGLSSGHIRTREKKGGITEEGRDPIKTVTCHELYLSDIPLEKYEKIMSIDSIGEHEVYDIEVDHEEHNFIANSVVVHNCRAPERRVYYIDTGNLQGPKREQAIERQRLRLMQKNINKNNQLSTEYDPHSTTEDIFIPTNSQGKGSRIETLPGGQALGETRDLQWFAQKLAAGLRIPHSMIDVHTEQNQQAQYSDMRVGQLYQIELRYLGYVKRIQRQFACELHEHFKHFCKMREVILPEGVKLVINAPNSFADYKDIEVNQARLNVAASSLGFQSLSKKYVLEEYMGLDHEQILKNEIDKLKELGLSDEQIKDMPEEHVSNLVYADQKNQEILKQYGLAPAEGQGGGGFGF